MKPGDRVELRNSLLRFPWFHRGSRGTVIKSMGSESTQVRFDSGSTLLMVSTAILSPLNAIECLAELGSPDETR